MRRLACSVSFLVMIGLPATSAAFTSVQVSPDAREPEQFVGDWREIGVYDLQGAPTAFFFRYLTGADGNLGQVALLAVDSTNGAGIRTNYLDIDVSCSFGFITLKSYKNFDADHRVVAGDGGDQPSVVQYSEAPPPLRRLVEIACGLDSPSPVISGRVQERADQLFAARRAN